MYVRQDTTLTINAKILSENSTKKNPVRFPPNFMVWLFKKTRWWQRHRGLMGDINFPPITRANSTLLKWMEKFQEGSWKKVARVARGAHLCTSRNYCSQSFFSSGWICKKKANQKRGRPTLKINFATVCATLSFLMRFYSIDLTVAVVIFWLYPNITWV